MNHVAEVIPHLSSDPQKAPVNLETAMQALVLDVHHPLALEITGEGSAKRFLVRAGRTEALAHAQAQLRMRYPQALFEVVAPDDDPLTCRAGEAASVIELREGAATYLPLQTWDERDVRQPGTDPLLGIIGSLSVPSGIRAIAQIAMVPAPPAWSKHQQRLALEHALDPEKAQRQVQLLQARGGAPSTLGVIILAVLCFGLLLFQHFKLQIPSWVFTALIQLVHGHWPKLTVAQWQQVGTRGGLLFLSIVVLTIVGRRLQAMMGPPLYDQRLAAQKTLSMAYRVRIRLYVIGPAGPARRPFWRTSWAALHRHTLRYEWRALWNDDQERRQQRQQREPVLLSLVAAYRQYHLARGNYFTPRHLGRWQVACLLGEDRITQGLRALVQMLVPTTFLAQVLVSWLEGWIAQRNWTRGVRRSQHLLAPESLAMLWHLLEGPALQETAFVHSRRTRFLLLPEALMTLASEHDRAIGVSIHAGQHLPFVPPASFIGYHTLLGGQSGEGKSTLMQHMALQAIHAGSACCVIDPHGDLVEQVLASIPPLRAQDTVLIDFGATDCAIGLNPLDVTLGRDRDKAIEDLIVTFKFIWHESWGNRMEAPLRHALLTLFEANQTLVQQDPLHGPDQQYTLLDVLPILTDESFCHALLDGIADDYLKRWWYLYYEPLTLQQQRDRTDPVFTKMSKLEMKVARRILGQGRSTLHFAQLIRERKVILVNLAKGKAGSDTAPLVGSTLMGLLLAALQEQATLAPEDRVPLPIFTDEFQALGGVDYQTMLAELRKWGGACCLATQSFAYLHEMNPALLPTVLANVKQKIIFRMSAKDASIIARELSVEEEDIVHLDPHVCYVSLPHAGRQQPTFSFHLHRPAAGSPRIANEIRAHSRLLYTRPAHDIDAALQTAITRTIQAPKLSEQGIIAQSGATEEKKRVRTRKGKTTDNQQPHGSLHALELLAVQADEKTSQDTTGTEASEELLQITTKDTYNDKIPYNRAESEKEADLDAIETEAERGSGTMEEEIEQ